MTRREEIEKELERISAEVGRLMGELRGVTSEVTELDAERKVWEPKGGNHYWFITVRGNIAHQPWYDTIIDRERFAANNCFPTEQAAKRERLRRQSMKATIPVPKLKQVAYAALLDDSGWHVIPINWNDKNVHREWYAKGRVKHTQEECQAWIDKFGHAWTTGDVA